MVGAGDQMRQRKKENLFPVNLVKFAPFPVEEDISAMYRSRLRNDVYDINAQFPCGISELIFLPDSYFLVFSFSYFRPIGFSSTP